jgi:hypothetical protein
MRMILFTLMWLVGVTVCGVCAVSGTDEVGKIKTLKGSVVIQRGNAPVPARMGMDILRNDTLITGANSSLGILFTDNSTLSLGNNSKIHLSEYEFDVAAKKAGFVGLVRRGTVVYLSGLIAKMNSEAVKFKTPTAVAGVRGTKLAISVEGGDDD